MPSFMEPKGVLLSSQNLVTYNRQVMAAVLRRQSHPIIINQSPNFVYEKISILRKYVEYVHRKEGSPNYRGSELVRFYCTSMTWCKARDYVTILWEGCVSVCTSRKEDEGNYTHSLRTPQWKHMTTIL
jgi:hypothetical protein